MGAWFADNWWWIVPIAGVVFIAGRVHDRTERGGSFFMSVLYVLMPFLEPDTHAHRVMWVDVFGKIFFAAIVIVILVAGYLFS